MNKVKQKTVSAIISDTWENSQTSLFLKSFNGENTNSRKQNKFSFVFVFSVGLFSMSL